MKPGSQCSKNSSTQAGKWATMQEYVQVALFIIVLCLTPVLLAACAIFKAQEPTYSEYDYCMLDELKGGTPIEKAAKICQDLAFPSYPRPAH